MEKEEIIISGSEIENEVFQMLWGQRSVPKETDKKEPASNNKNSGKEER